MSDEHEYAERMFPAPIDLGIAQPDREPRHVVLPTRLIVRGSAAAPV